MGKLWKTSMWGRRWPLCLIQNLTWTSNLQLHVIRFELLLVRDIATVYSGYYNIDQNRCSQILKLSVLRAGLGIPGYVVPDGLHIRFTLSAEQWFYMSIVFWALALLLFWFLYWWGSWGSPNWNCSGDNDNDSKRKYFRWERKLVCTPGQTE